MASSESEALEYTIDDLASVSEVPSRTIRFYQSKGALQSPKIKGRVAYYGAEHVERLKLIASLQDRGLRIDAIRDLVSRIDKGELDLGEWLGLEQQLAASWAEDRPRTATEPELYELCGRKRAGLIADLARHKLVQRHGDTFIVRSPALLHAAMKLEAAGVDLAVAAGAAEIMRKHVARLASDVAAYFFARVGEGLGSGDVEPDLGEVFRELRPVGMETVRVVFGQEMERVLREHVESGKTAKLPRPKKRRTTR
jgi:DNA-binding transcriptional MerR regulator